MPFKKPVVTAAQAISHIKDGMRVMIGGFNYAGVPYTLTDALAESGVKNLHLISCDTNYVNEKIPQGSGHGKLIFNRQVKKYTGSHTGLNQETQRQYAAGELEIDFSPQGTLAERIRAGGYGLGGILTPTGLGTSVAEGKRIIEVDGKEFLLELPLRADVALIKAHKADAYGNLVYLGTGRNFNPIMAFAAETVIVEADKIVEVGEIPPDDVVTPSALVTMLIKKGASYYASRT